MSDRESLLMAASSNVDQLEQAIKSGRLDLEDLFRLALDKAPYCETWGRFLAYIDFPGNLGKYLCGGKTIERISAVGPNGVLGLYWGQDSICIATWRDLPVEDMITIWDALPTFTFKDFTL